MILIQANLYNSHKGPIEFFIYRKEDGRYEMHLQRDNQKRFYGQYDSIRQAEEHIWTYNEKVGEEL